MATLTGIRFYWNRVRDFIRDTAQNDTLNLLVAVVGAAAAGVVVFTALSGWATLGLTLSFLSFIPVITTFPLAGAVVVGLTAAVVAGLAATLALRVLPTLLFDLFLDPLFSLIGGTFNLIYDVGRIVVALATLIGKGLWALGGLLLGLATAHPKITGGVVAAGLAVAVVAGLALWIGVGFAGLSVATMFSGGGVLAAGIITTALTIVAGKWLWGNRANIYNRLPTALTNLFSGLWSSPPAAGSSHVPAHAGGPAPVGGATADLLSRLLGRAGGSPAGSPVRGTGAGGGEGDSLLGDADVKLEMGDGLEMGDEALSRKPVANPHSGSAAYGDGWSVVEVIGDEDLGDGAAPDEDDSDFLYDS